MLDQGNGFRMEMDICLSRKMGARISSLPVEIVWVTTWERHADTVVAPLCNLKRGLRVLTRPPDAQPGGAWKFDVIRDLVNTEDRPFVWVDDDIETFQIGGKSARKWADQLAVRNLLISPDPRNGLTHGDFDAVEEFLEQAGG